MATRRLEYDHHYMTASQARRKLGLTRAKFDLRIERSIFPQPTTVDVNGVRYFDQEWLAQSRATLENSQEESP